jgi:hypothetical protein
VPVVRTGPVAPLGDAGLTTGRPVVGGETLTPEPTDVVVLGVGEDMQRDEVGR